MQNDHLADALLFLDSALSSASQGIPVSRYDIEGAIREVKAEIEQQERDALDAKANADRWS